MAIPDATTLVNDAKGSRLASEILDFAVDGRGYHHGLKTIPTAPDLRSSLNLCVGPARRVRFRPPTVA